MKEPTAEDVKRWMQLLVGRGEQVMLDDIRKTLPLSSAENEIHYKIIKGDEVNSLHMAISRHLNDEQMIVLRDKLIRRTPSISENKE